MIDIRKLKELVKLMVENDLVELDLRDENETVTLKRPNPGGSGGGMMMVPQQGYHAMPSGGGGGAPAAASPGGGGEPAADEDEGLVPIVSPMVGTFYSAPDPESPAYASVGTKVSAGSVVCIVEAMKVFSEIKSEVSGTVEKVLVKNAEPVEFGQALFMVRPN